MDTVFKPILQIKIQALQGRQQQLLFAASSKFSLAGSHRFLLLNFLMVMLQLIERIKQEKLRELLQRTNSLIGQVDTQSTYLARQYQFLIENFHNYMCCIFKHQSQR